MNILKLFYRNLTQGPSTVAFPFGPAWTPPKLRGRIRFDLPACTGCRACEQVCAPGAIRFDKTPEGLRFMMWHNSCVFCGLCNFYCPTDAIVQSDDWHLAHPTARMYEMAIRELIPYTACSACGTKTLASAPNPVGVEPPFSAEEIEQFRHLCPGCRKKALEERTPNHAPTE
ncbi:4Fe-4S dicluster domain-containing protein [Paludibacterium sp.]|uniref:4Fe-4S dicluster domain-containing protein n=2 Tax=Paludibacterium sp. TaxID=1917523 RepID=UPI0025EEB345|nr:4Fe-4S dicluster domain-containing protein [Paludibacterium sp.]MBV8646105.1 4Fe-4S dicluster domain-containing protein [Paludibacterium sp.]